jgi:hypothetical protein
MLDRKLVKEWASEKGTKLRAEISPCSWIHEVYGLQLTVSMAESSDKIFPRAETSFSASTEVDFDALCDRVHLTNCSTARCDCLVLEGGKNAGSCDTCLAIERGQKNAAELTEEAARSGSRDARRKRLGYTHKAEVWVTPEEGEDEFYYCYFKGEPTTEEIHQLIAVDQQEPDIEVISL